MNASKIHEQRGIKYGQDGECTGRHQRDQEIELPIFKYPLSGTKYKMQQEKFTQAWRERSRRSKAPRHIYGEVSEL